MYLRVIYCSSNLVLNCYLFFYKSHLIDSQRPECKSININSEI